MTDIQFKKHSFFDTHKYVRSLTNAGMSEEQAQVFVDAQVQILERVENIEDQILLLNVKIDTKINEVKEELIDKIDAQGKHLEGKIDAQGKYLEGKVDKLEGKVDKLDDKIDAVSAHLIRNMMFGFGIVTIAIIVFKFI